LPPSKAGESYFLARGGGSPFSRDRVPNAITKSREKTFVHKDNINRIFIQKEEQKGNYFFFATITN